MMHIGIAVNFEAALFLLSSILISLHQRVYLCASLVLTYIKVRSDIGVRSALIWQISAA